MRKNKRTRRNVRIFVALVAVLGLAIVVAAFTVRSSGEVETFRYEKPASWEFYERLKTFEQQLAQDISAKLPERKVKVQEILDKADPELQDILDEADPELWNALKKINRFRELFAQARGQFATPGVIENAVVRVAIKNVLERGSREILEQSWDTVAAFCASNQELIQSIRDAAALGGPIRRLDFSKGYWMRRGHLEGLREIPLLFAADAMVQMRAGDVNAALADVETIMEFGDLLLGEPALPSQYMRMNMYTTAVRVFSEAIPAGALNTEQTLRLVARLGKAYHRESFVDALIGEGLAQQMMFSDREGISGRHHPLLKMTASLVIKQDRSLCARVMNHVVAAAHLPYYEAAVQLQPIQAELYKRPNSYFGVIYSQAKSMLYRGAHGYLEPNARFEALLDVARLGLLIEDYHRQHGAYPESLEVFAPEFGGAIPVDRMTGQAYIYKPDAENFQLRSNVARRNGIDDLVWRRRMRKSDE